jgi:hypothetical protein
MLTAPKCINRLRSLYFFGGSNKARLCGLLKKHSETKEYNKEDFHGIDIAEYLLLLSTYLASRMTQ